MYSANRLFANYLYYACLLVLLFSHTNGNAQTRFWVSDIPALWSGNNWANASNAAPDGLGPPTSLQLARFDNGGTGNCTLDVSLDTIAGLTFANYNAVLEMNGNDLLVTGACTFNSGEINDQLNTSELTILSGAATVFAGTEFNVRLDVTSDGIEFDGSVFHRYCLMEKTGSGNNYGSGGNIFNDTLIVTHSGTGGYLLFAGVNRDTFNSSFTFSVTNGGLGYISYVGGTSYAAQGVVVESYGGSTGMYFGQNDGALELGAGSTISIGPNGFNSGELRLRNIYQTAGTTGLSIAATGTAIVDQRACYWLGDVTVDSPGIRIQGNTINGDLNVTKSGITNDISAGGNKITGDANFTNNGTGYILLGNGLPDTFDLDLNVNNNGGFNFYLGYNSLNNFVGGNYNGNNNPVGGSNSYMLIADLSTSSVTFNGDVIINNNGASNDSRIYLGNAGQVIINGNLVMNQNTTGDNAYIFIADNANSQVTVNGTTTLTNGGGGNLKRVFLGNSGDVILNDSVFLNNHSTATSSEMYVGHAITSTATINGPIQFESTDLLNDGIFVSISGGTTTLAAGNPVTIGPGGFIGAALFLRNFTQLGLELQQMQLGTNTTLTLYDCLFQGAVDFESGNINLRGSRYEQVVSLRKTGAANDFCFGGNVMLDSTILFTSGTGYWLFGSSQPDSFLNHVIVNDSSTFNFYLAYSSANNYIDGSLIINKTCFGPENSFTYIATVTGSSLLITGDVIVDMQSSSLNDRLYLADAGNLTINGNLTATINSTQNTYLLFASNSVSSLDVGGNVSILIDDLGLNHETYIGSNGDVNITGDLIIDNATAINSSQVIVANSTESLVTIGGVSRIENDGSGVNRRVFLGNGGDVVFSDSLIIINSSDAVSSQVFLNHAVQSENLYNGPIIVESQSLDNDGIYFGNANGTGTLAAGLTVSITPNGFIGNNLFFRNFNQLGNTPQTLIATGSTIFNSFNSNWGGDVEFSAPRITTFGSVYNGDAILTKTGAGDDASAGGNFFAGNLTMNNSGSSYFLMANGSSDTIILDVDINQTGQGNLYFAYNGPANYVGGDLTCDITTNGAGTSTFFSTLTGTNLQVDGNVSITNSSSATNNYIYLGSNGNVNIDGDLSIINNSTATGVVRSFVATNVLSTVVIGGKAIFENNILGNSNSDFFVGNSGNITIEDTLILSNNSNAPSSRFYINRLGTGIFNGDIIVESTHPDCDGLSFGDIGGISTLANGRTISVGPGGYVAGLLYLYNFNQIGTTAQSLHPTGSTITLMENCSWEGDVDFSSPRFFTNRSTYFGLAELEKTGSGDDNSVGGNYYHQDVILSNTGTSLFRHGLTLPDSVLQNLIIDNIGNGSIRFADGSPNNFVSGNVTVNQLSFATTNSDIILSTSSAASLLINGNLDITSASTANSSLVRIANQGDVVINGDFIVDHTSNMNSSQILVCENATASLLVEGITRIENKGTGSTAVVALGDQGNSIFNDSVYLINSATANNSDFRVGNGSTAMVSFNEDVLIESTIAGSDGIRFGVSGGNITLADLQRIVIGTGGFVSGNLHLYNFHQIGTTAQSLTTTGSTYLLSSNNLWEADVTLVGPRNRTFFCRYEGDLIFEKTGGVDDVCGGNVVLGDAIVTNSSIDYLLFGNNAPDSIMGDLTMLNTGSDGLYLAHAQAGNYIGGNLDFTTSGTGSNSFIFICSNNGSGLTVDGNVTLTNSGTSTTSNMLIANFGVITINGDLNINQVSTAPNSFIQLALNPSANITVNGVTTVDNTSTGNTGTVILGSNGIMTFNDTLYLLNSGTASNSIVYCNNSGFAVSTYNAPIIIESDAPNSDGVYFGASGGNGILASGQPILVGPNGFSSGILYFRQFTQLGATTIDIDLTGNVILDFFSSTFNGNLSFSAPSIFLRTSVFNGPTEIQKIGATNDASFGGNTFNNDLTITNSGTGFFLLPNSTPDDYNGDVTYVKNGSGLLLPAHNSNCTYAGNINFNSNTSIDLGSNGGRVTFDGAGPQQINDLGSTPNPNFRRLTLNSADTLTLNMPIEIQTEINFTSGILANDINNLLILRDNALSVGANNNSFVQGFVEKIGNDAFQFPVGDSLFRPISISAPSSTASRFRATYIFENPDPTYAYGLRDPSIDHVSTREYWLLDRTNGTNSVNVTLSWDVNSGGVTNLPDLIVARWDGVRWTNGGNAATTGNTTAGTVSSSVSFNSFSPFTLGSIDISNPLPVELISFTAEKLNKTVLLEWTTATEIQNDYFTIERSTNGIDFESIAQVQGAGNTNFEINYSLVDHHPKSGLNFYRLKQTDFDGSFSYSQTEMVIFDNQEDVASIRMFVAEQQLVLAFLPEKGESVNLSFYDMNGKLLHKSNIEAIPGNSLHYTELPLFLARGIYLIRAESETLSHSTKIFY